MSELRAVFWLGGSPRGEATALAERFALPLYDASHLQAAKTKHIEGFVRQQVVPTAGCTCSVFLASENPLRLLQLAGESMLVLSADLANPTLNYRRLKGGGKQQMLAKAVGLGAGTELRVLDATAGLGRDAFILAGLGASVRMLERAPAVRTLLESALERARSSAAAQRSDFAQTISRLSLQAGDAINYMAALSRNKLPEVIYLDPMFPPRQKHALVKKEMRILHDLVGADPDAEQLFAAARATGARRIVVKRPRLAPALSSAQPNHVFSGQSNRFDVYLSA